MQRPSCGTFVVGRFGQIEQVDDAACDLVQYSRAELLALHGSDLILPEERPRVATSLERMRDGEIQEQRGRLLRKDGVSVPVLVSARRLSEGKLALVVTELVDQP